MIAGIEVSCADRIHVVAMFDWKKNNVVNEIKSWLQTNLLSEQDGVFRTSYDTMSELTDKGAICYIAHINTSDMFKDQKYLTGGYRNRLLSSNHSLLIGVSSLEKRKDVSRFLIEYRKDNIKYLLDNDAHDIDDLSKNYFWVKGHKVNYQMFEEALIDYDVSINFEKEHTAAQYIKGVYIEENLFESASGFLSGEKYQPFVVRFSKSLNCFIGGRGTGKSSILELLQYVLSQRCKSVDMLEFLCKHGATWILYEYNNEEYMIKMNMPVPTGLETHVLHRFGQNIEERYNYKYRFDEDEVATFAFSQYLEIYKVIDNDNNGIYFEKQTKKRELLDRMFDTKYSVNDLVSTASGDDINLFIYNLMMRKKELSSVSDVVRARSLSGFMNTIEKIKTTLAQRKQEVEMILSDFNRFQEKRLRILYYQELKYEEPPISDWFLPGSSSKEYCFNYAITKENILDYLLSVFDGEGTFGFFGIIAKKKLTSNQYPIIDYMDTDNKRIMNTDANIIDEENQQELINKIIHEVYKDINCSGFISYLKKSLKDAEEFVLEFNVNSKTAVESTGCSYKDVRQLSLGQKVVAMLDFVLAYSDYSGDYRPLIIDQPEDNLDSQYIYNNLVQQLRDVKERRQVIIATHNATIVTNAKADQVIIMESDNKHGTVKNYGYPGENTIKKYIINYLEGGIDSFKHKVSVYSPVLK